MCKNFRKAFIKLFFVTFLFLGHSGITNTLSASFQIPETLTENNSIRGYPLISSFSRRDYQAQPQNWAIVQDENGILYIGNGDGILEYDGVSWRIIPLENHTTVRSLAINDDHIIFAGGVGEFGYLSHTNNFSRSFISLNFLIPDSAPEFADVWNVLSTSDGIYFSTREALFLFDGSEIVYWPAENTRFHRAYYVGGNLYVHCERQGLLVMKDGALQKVPGTEMLASPKRFTLLPYDEDRILLGWWDEGLWLLSESGLTPFSSDAAPIYESSVIYAALKINEEHFAFSVLGSGLIIINKRGELISHIDRDSGLSNQYVLSMETDRYGTLWLALNDGIDKVEISSPFSLFDERSGLTADVLTATMFRDNLYVATSSGVFELPLSESAMPMFRHVKGIGVQVWDFQSIDNQLYTIANNGLYALRENGFRRVTPLIGLSLHASKIDNQILFTGLSDGLGYVHRTKNGEQFRKIEMPYLPEVRSIIEHTPGQLWLTTLYQGLYSVSYHVVHNEELQITNIRRFGEQQGLPGLSGITVFTHNDGLFFNTPQGFYTYREEDDRFEPGVAPHPSIDRNSSLQHFEVSESGTIWLVENGMLQQGVLRDDAITWYSEPFSRLSYFQPFSKLILFDDESLWIGSSDGLILYQNTKDYSVESEFTAILRDVIAGTDTLLFRADARRLKWESPLDFNQRNIRFAFSAPGMLSNHETAFRYILLGEEEDWSIWSTTAFKEFGNLKPGSYEFQVQGKDVYGNTSETAVFAFVIAPPWFATWWAYVLYLFLGFAGLKFVISWRTKSLENRNMELEEKVTLRTQELEEQKEKLVLANTAKGNMLRIVAHDLKNPLNIIYGHSDALMDEGIANQQLSAIHNNARKMLESIDQLLEANTLEYTHLELQKTKFPLREVVLEVVENNRIQAFRKKQEIKLELTSDNMIEADRMRIYEVCDNVISNAIKYSPEHTKISVTVNDRSHEQICCTIADEGPGFTETDKKFLFQKNKRLSAQPTANESSTGLGLYIVKELMDLHEAIVTLEDAPTGGAIFHLIFSVSDPKTKQKR